MTSIPALPPASLVSTNATGAVNSPRPMTTAPDFQSQMKTQSKPALLPPDPASAPVKSDSAIDMTRRPDVEAMLQMLAWRKVTLNGPSKMGRLLPGAFANGLEADQDSAEWRAESSGSEFIAGVPEKSGEPYGSGLNASAIAVALSGTTLIWIPVEIVRPPLQSPRVAVWRRRKPSSVEGHHSDQSEADVDNNSG